jgi:hypothetical protein
VIVHSDQLTEAAATVRRRKRPQRIPAEGVVVNAPQLDAAAQLLRDAEPSICNGDVQERPGFIEWRQQEKPAVLVFEVGILPSITYRIDRKGNVS